MSAEQVRSAIEKLAKRPGYGSLKARLWICGIEEHGGGNAAFDDAWVLEEAGKRADSSAHAAFSDGAGGSAAWRYSFELAAFAHNIPGDQFGAAWVKQPELLHLLNLLVIPKPNERDWNIEAISRGEYLQIIREHRVPYLRAMRPPGSVVVCHGQRHRALLEEAFVDNHESPEIVPGDRDKHLYVYAQSRTVLAPFFVPHQLPRREFEALKIQVRKLIAG